MKHSELTRKLKNLTVGLSETAAQTERNWSNKDIRWISMKNLAVMCEDYLKYWQEDM